MKTALLVLGLTIAAAYSTVVPVKSERKVADATFLKRQKQILDLFVGVGHNEYFQHEFADFDITAHSDQFYDYKVVDEFWYAYKRGYLPKDGVFSMSSHLTRKQTIYLFDVFFFAKDFDTFYKCAVWAKKHIHPMMFAYAYTLALMHREDCHYYELPPLYEIFPTYFVPQETFQKIYDARMYGHKEAKFTYNNTGYEYNYHTSMFGGPFGYDAYEPHLDYKVSYFREDVGNNAYYAMWQLRYPSWMSPEKYKKSYWFKRGEGFYYTHQQLFARYSLERLANGLPYVEPLYWDKPIKVGYTPRIFHYNGYPFYTRPDNYEPKYFNKYYVQKAQDYERRIYDAIDEGQFWFNDTRYYINDEEGVDKLGQVIYGAYYKPNQEYYGSYDKKNQEYYGPYDKQYQEYYGSYYYASLNALGYAVKTSNDHSYIGGAMTYPGTSLRDPAFFNYLNRLVWLFQYHKKNFKPYTQKELGFPGVVVKDFEVDKLLTYFERYDYEVSNAIPVKDYKEYFNMKYFASQWRLNHKPFTYKVTVNSDNAYEGMVRIFIGPKYDSEEHDLTLEQKRMLMVEFDRFPVKMVAGVNLFERNYKDSPVYTNDNYGFRQLYSKINNAMNSQEPYYYYDHKVSCGVPDRFQLPRGWKNGQPFTFYVVVSPFEKKYNGESKDFYTTCGSSKLYDYRPLGFPFDRPIYESEWKVPNIFYKDVPVYHKGEYDIYQKEY